ncbi:MAG: hypothetical protein Q9227_009179 [Pyrenula ochraceoflavens]
MAADASTTSNAYYKPVQIAVIGGTGLQTLSSFELVAKVNPSTPWGFASSPIHIYHYHSSAGAIPIAFISRHGSNHELAPHEIPNRANIAALRSLGIRTIIAFSAAGSLQENVEPRDFVIPDQIIDRTKGNRPWTFFEGGVVGHIGFGDPFDTGLHKVVGDCGKEMAGPQFRIHDRGTVVCIEGPQFSTRAESSLYRQWGGTAINMSAIPEAKLAKEAEIAYQMVCMSTDYDCWHTSGTVSVEEVFANMRANAENAANFTVAIIAELCKREHQDLVRAKHLEGQTKLACAVTGKDGRRRAAVERLEWLFPGCFA